MRNQQLIDRSRRDGRIRAFRGRMKQREQKEIMETGRTLCMDLSMLEMLAEKRGSCHKKILEEIEDVKRKIEICENLLEG